jgi:Fic family protein
MNLRLAKEKFRPTKAVEEIENLIAAYELAQTRPLTEKNLLQAHKILAKTLLPQVQRGHYRQTRAGVFSPAGLVYLAVEPEFVPREMTTFFAGLASLLSDTLSLSETFYFASLLHLRFVHIHPFVDGNGRAARLLEKWFLAHHLGPPGWQVPAERYYKEHRADYYNHLNLGVNFYELDYDQCLPFLLMLPRSLEDGG